MIWSTEEGFHRGDLAPSSLIAEVISKADLASQSASSASPENPRA